MIEFLCPEGHKIRCPKEKAGRPAKCPRCGVGFRIPTIEELGLSESTVADASLTGEEVTNVPTPPSQPPLPGGSGRLAPTPAAPSKERQIEFLCPNGHHLHGPASLQGRAGECPECGSRFRIPVIEEQETEAEPEPGYSGHPLAGRGSAEPDLPAELEVPAEDEISLENPPPTMSTRCPDHEYMVPEPEHVESAQIVDFSQVQEGGGPGPAKQPDTFGERSGGTLDLPTMSTRCPVPGRAAPGTHPLAALFIELWAARGEGSRVEVHLESGSVLLPDGYLKSRSQQDYAVLVTRDPDGCSTITVVPWNSIARIIMRAIKQVPGEVVR